MTFVPDPVWQALGSAAATGDLAAFFGRAPASSVLAIALSAAVPLRIAEYRAHGGPGEGDVERVREFAWELAGKGDALQFRGKDRGQAAALFNQLADALAVLAFCPGGVTFAGSHYEARPEGTAP